MDWIVENPGTFWISVGIVLVLVEVFILPTMGFLFGGLAAVTLGGLIAYGAIGTDSLTQHISLFFAFTVAWAVILWKPLKYGSKKPSAYTDMIGARALALADFSGKETGTVRWSGTQMSARLAPDAGAISIKKGQEVEITEVKGNVVFVKPC